MVLQLIFLKLVNPNFPLTSKLFLFFLDDHSFFLLLLEMITVRSMAELTIDSLNSTQSIIHTLMETLFPAFLQRQMEVYTAN